MTTITKQLRNMKAEGKPTKVSKTQAFINSMTNWQNSQWLRAGADHKQAEEFSSCLFTKEARNKVNALSL